LSEKPRLPTGVEYDAEIFAKVQKCFCDALELEVDEVGYYAKVLDDLGAESLDLLDVVFRLERAFDVQIPRGGLENKAKMVDGQPGEIDGKLTKVGADTLRLIMPEVPPEEILEGMKVTEIPRVFRVGTFYVLVWVLVTHKKAMALLTPEERAALEKAIAEKK
jgi:acyl carrier protein